MKESSSLRWIAFVRPAVGLFAVLSNRKLVRENALLVAKVEKQITKIEGRFD